MVRWESGNKLCSHTDLYTDTSKAIPSLLPSMPPSPLSLPQRFEFPISIFSILRHLITFLTVLAALRVTKIPLSQECSSQDRLQALGRNELTCEFIARRIIPYTSKLGVSETKLSVVVSDNNERGRRPQVDDS